MKHSVTFIAFLFIVLFNKVAFAGPSPTLPNFDLGIKAGANFAKLSGDEWEQSMKAGFTGGAFAGLRVKKIGVQIEALVNTAKYTLSGATSGSDFKTTNVDVPILFQYKIIPMLWLQAGPQFSTVVSASDPTGADAKSLFKSGFAGVIGLELKLPIKFNLGARYIIGFSDVNNSGVSGAWQQRSAQIYLGFRFL